LIDGIDCEGWATSGPVSVSFTGDVDLSVSGSGSVSSIAHLTPTVHESAADTTYTDGCSLAILDIIMGLTDLDVSFLAFIDDRIATVANDFADVLEERIEVETPEECRE